MRVVCGWEVHRPTAGGVRTAALEDDGMACRWQRVSKVLNLRLSLLAADLLNS